MTQPHPQRCIHYDACWFVRQHSRCPDDEPTEYEKSLPECRFDTRPHTPAAPATEPERRLTYTVGECMEQCLKARKAEREQVLDVLEEFLNSDDHLSLFKWEVREQIRSLRGGAP